MKSDQMFIVFVDNYLIFLALLPNSLPSFSPVKWTLFSQTRETSQTSLEFVIQNTKIAPLNYHNLLSSSKLSRYLASMADSRFTIPQFFIMIIFIAILKVLVANNTGIFALPFVCWIILPCPLIWILPLLSIKVLAFVQTQKYLMIKQWNASATILLALLIKTCFSPQILNNH